MERVNFLNKPIILFDGICELCDQFCLFIMDHSKRSFHFIPLQSEEAVSLLKSFGEDITLDTVILIQNNQLYKKSTAVLEICKYFNKPWSFLSMLRFVPVSIRDYLYSIIARKRYKWFGKKEYCRLPKQK